MTKYIHYTHHEGIRKTRTSTSRQYTHCIWKRARVGALEHVFENGQWLYENGQPVRRPRTEPGKWECTSFSSSEQLARAEANRFAPYYETVVKAIDQVIKK